MNDIQSPVLLVLSDRDYQQLRADYTELGRLEIISRLQGKLVTAKVAASILYTDESTIYNYVKEGRLSPVGDGVMRFDLAELVTKDISKGTHFKNHKPC